jgi:NADH dehydrogenase
MQVSTRARVVIIGGGFGGLVAARTLQSAPVDVTLVDKRNHHLFQPLLYQVATAQLGTSEVAWPVRHLLRRQHHTQVLLGQVNGIDTESRAVLLADGGRLEYDWLIIATGARHAYFGHGEWEPFAPGLKTLEDATTIRRKLLLAFEEAERETDPARRRALLTFAIVGGGPTGVELAGAIIELARDMLAEGFHGIRREEIRVVLIEGAGRVLLNFKPVLSAYAKRALEKLGVEVIVNSMVTAVDASGLTYGDTRIEAGTVLWAAGVQASPAASWLGAPADKVGRIKVEADLTVPGHNEIFAIGDTATITMPNGKPVPGIADAAKQGGRHAANVIKARLAGDTSPKPFHYHHAGDLATIGKRAAVIDFGWVKLTGWIAWWAWGIAHIYFLIGVRNRVFVALSWLWHYLTGFGTARLITQGDAEAEAARLTQRLPHGS